MGTKEEKAQLLKALYSEGRTIREIQSITGMTSDKIKQYLNPNKSYITKNNRTVRVKEHEAAVKKVEERADLVRGKRDVGDSIPEISRSTGFTYNTVKRYLSESFSPVNGHYGRKREGKLSRFRNDVLDMRTQGKTYAQIIHAAIRLQGYTGTQDAILDYTITKAVVLVSV